MPDKLKALTIVKEGTPQLNTEGKREFKMVLLTEGYKLTKNAQHASRRTMKKYMATCRVILVTNSTSKVILAIRSRCLAPSLPSQLAARIAQKGNRNMRRAILTVKACKVA